MEGTCFTFDSDELLTRAKNQSATHTTGRGSAQAKVARPEGCLPQPSAAVFRCVYPSQCRRRTENNPTPHAASQTCCWQQHARFSLGSPHMTGTLARTLQRQVRFLPGQERTSCMKMFCSYLEFGAMVHSWRRVGPGRQSQLPFAKIFLDVGVREFVPSICRQKHSRNQSNCCLEYMQIWRGPRRHKGDDWDGKTHVRNRTIDIYFCLSQLSCCLALTTPGGEDQWVFFLFLILNIHTFAFPFLMIRISILSCFRALHRSLISCRDVCNSEWRNRRHQLATKGDELHFLLLIKV